ncbi:exopolyphosphatase [Amylibacter marinus]|uniref:Exopolyphosphatase n=2 Tax=Amylibacter marinus TaxID=1475483 RepID=A0ABQ5VT15_9RHOB|nr:exopolyphosphatase [Amylibacter marinus]
MLIARPHRDDFKVVDAFSKTVYLGKGLDRSGRLSEPAILRTIGALNICAAKLRKHNVKKMRLVATAACRQAQNGRDFIRRVKQETGLKLEVIKPHEEARLAVIGSASHVKPCTEQVLVLDIGGGSTELVWLDISGVRPEARRGALMRLQRDIHKAKKQPDQMSGMRVVDWISVPLGVTTLREQFSDVDGDKARYAMMSWYFEEYIAQFGPYGEEDRDKILPKFQIIGTSGTVTTIAASYMKLRRYDRGKVDGYEMTSEQVEAEIERYLVGGPKWRAANTAIGAGRIELIMSGAAILQAVLRVWPTDLLTVADRGLREGILYSLMVADGHLR